MAIGRYPGAVLSALVLAGLSAISVVWFFPRSDDFALIHFTQVQTAWAWITEGWSGYFDNYPEHGADGGVFVRPAINALVWLESQATPVLGYNAYILSNVIGAFGVLAAAWTALRTTQMSAWLRETTVVAVALSPLAVTFVTVANNKLQLVALAVFVGAWTLYRTQRVLTPVLAAAVAALLHEGGVIAIVALAAPGILGGPWVRGRALATGAVAVAVAAVTHVNVADRITEAYVFASSGPLAHTVLDRVVQATRYVLWPLPLDWYAMCYHGCHPVAWAGIGLAAATNLALAATAVWLLVSRRVAGSTKLMILGAVLCALVFLFLSQRFRHMYIATPVFLCALALGLEQGAWRWRGAVTGLAAGVSVVLLAGRMGTLDARIDAWQGARADVERMQTLVAAADARGVVRLADRHGGLGQRAMTELVLPAGVDAIFHGPTVGAATTPELACRNGALVYTIPGPNVRFHGAPLTALDGAEINGVGIEIAWHRERDLAAKLLQRAGLAAPKTRTVVETVTLTVPAAVRDANLVMDHRGLITC